ncbi:NADH-FMN oxidoreductase RutF, flavin reductase (DIM6/NTAB) family [Jatrophihabitans endophyticus]|uniref:NADH-FMN oxidoreductase RutF, flavin reductase (DIM6/NTAB) family n=1 Tax=Jatrophihabitans endophyticus TaxID=1206085 RepID=A0A1M5M2T6_9ACTN|nr:flavin reductase family protein [Jatrophihabitans endophyticus]SHG71536.1 NADH-FMN oxidoreductase RutF, flavin reductase (DIM6/NTAB) family [Jatrophihabitans endophyticus]
MTDRLETTPAQLGRQMYPWLTASLIPRAIAWVSSVSADGVDNVAPHSFTTVVGVDPPTLCFVSVGEKDTLRNVRATGEFVLNVGTESLLHAMNDSATNFPDALSEFDEAGLQREPSAVVRPPRVRAAPVAFECRVTGEYPVGNCTTVFGEVVHVAAHHDVLAADGLPDAAALAPLARLGRSEWSRLGDVTSLERIRFEDWTAGRRSRRD